MPLSLSLTVASMAETVIAMVFSLRPMRRWGPVVSTLAAVVWLVLSVSPAQAYDVLLSADWTGQGYQLRDAQGRIFNRRRLDTLFQLYVYDILPEPKDPSKRRKPHPQMYFVAACRLDADMGDYSNVLGDSTALLRQEDPAGPSLQVLYAYLGVTGLARGWLALSLGRRFFWDAMDAYQFDGVTLSVRSPWHVELDLFGGSRVSGVLPIDSPLLVLDGTDARDEIPRWEPMVGVTLRSDWRYLSGRMTYRHTFSKLPEFAEQQPGYLLPSGDIPTGLNRWGTAEELFSLWVSSNPLKGHIVPYAGMAYSILTDRVSRAALGVSFSWGRHGITAEYARFEPTFDGDSIFNVFNVLPFRELRLWYRLWVTSRWSGYARASMRLFQGTAPQTQTSDDPTLERMSPGAGLGVRYLGRRLRARADWYYQDGYGGRTFGMDLWWRHWVLPGVLSWEGRTTVVHWADGLRENLRGVTAGVALGALWRVHPRFAIQTVLEDNFGEYYKADIRFSVMLHMDWCRMGRCGMEGSWL